MQKMNRRDFGLQMTKSMATAGVLFGGHSAMNAQIVWTTKEWELTAFNELVTARGEIKQLFDITSAVSTLDKVKNSLNGFQIGFGLPATEIRIAAGLHGQANLLNFDDFIWNKYQVGEWLDILDPETGKPALRNPFYKSHFTSAHLTGNPDDLQSQWHDASMEGLQRRGVRFLGCHTAIEFQVRDLVQRRRIAEPPEAIVRELLEHLQPGNMMVVAMVAAIAVLQNKGQYSYLKL